MTWLEGRGEWTGCDRFSSRMLFRSPFLDPFVPCTIGGLTKTGVISQIPNLLAVWGDKGVYRARALTLVEGTFQAARVNDECVRGIWSSLGMELYYFTNDDEER